MAYRSKRRSGGGGYRRKSSSRRGSSRRSGGVSRRRTGGQTVRLVIQQAPAPSGQVFATDAGLMGPAAPKGRARF